jgi:hypothetical protein
MIEEITKVVIVMITKIQTEDILNGQARKVGQMREEVSKERVMTTIGMKLNLVMLERVMIVNQKIIITTDLTIDLEIKIVTEKNNYKLYILYLVIDIYDH